MTDRNTNEALLELFIFETSHLIEQLEFLILNGEKESCFRQESINEIFRIMHTIKGSSAMMMLSNLSVLAHSIEDLFYFLREKKPGHINCSDLSDLVLEGIDFIKVEIEKIKNNDEANGNACMLIDRINSFLSLLKVGKDSSCSAGIQITGEKQQPSKNQENNSLQAGMSMYKAVISFEEGCEMENIRAYSVIHKLKVLACEIRFIPEDIMDNDSTAETIKKDGFIIYFRSDDSYDRLHEFFMSTVFLKQLHLLELNNEEFYQMTQNTEDPCPSTFYTAQEEKELNKDENEYLKKDNPSSSAQQSIVSVSVSKLDRLMDLVGEMVIAEAMVVQNPDLNGLMLDNFQKASRQLNKITGEIQDLVMSIRMVPLSATFHKMHRIVRDMCKKLGKEVNLDIIGEETEVDKNIIEHISDPLMHLVRNAIDHGIETGEERQQKGKPLYGTITFEAKNAGNDVLIIVKDDGIGLSKDKILKKAQENGLLYKPEPEMSEREIFNLVLLPGFSTNDSVTEFSGRGVGMDVVSKNIEAIGGSVSVESTPGKGTAITLKIPLTLAIIDGMNIKVGNSRYTLPTTSIRESFRPGKDEVFTDPDNNEMIMVRGQCYPILRLYEFYKVQNAVTSIPEGIIIMLEQENQSFCVFADELLGQQQVVVKALPAYIRRFKKIKGLTGCTLLGDGSISLILDAAGLINV